MTTNNKKGWIKSKFIGVRYYSHETRKHGVKYDRYFSGSYQVTGKRKFMGFGWSSEGWTERKVSDKINEYKYNSKTGTGPTTLKEEIALKEADKKEVKSKQGREYKNNKPFDVFFQEVYEPSALKHKKPHTIENEKGFFVNWLKPEIGHLPFTMIKAFHLEKIKKKLVDAGRSPRTLQYVFATFRQIWNYAMINDIITDPCPTRKIKLPRVENKRSRFLSYEEAESLLNKVKAASKQTYNMTLFSLHTGTRAKEIFTLTWGVIDFDNGSVLIRDSKGKTRHVYLTIATKKMLQELYQGQPPNELVFKDRNGEQIMRISKSFHRAVQKLGFNDGVTDRRDKVIFHTCRHTFASWHVQSGTDLYTVKELLGHSTIQLTERYSHLRPEGLKNATRIFDENIGTNNVVSFKNTAKGS